jgi:PAS domain S-box-containing protein
MNDSKPVTTLATSAHGKARKPSVAVRSLRARLEEAEQALQAIRTGDVDALVVGGPAGTRLFTLEGAEHRYRVVMEAMSEGVATVNEQGLVTYCNARFAAIVGARREWTVGSPLARLVPEVDRERFQALIAAGTADRSEGEFWLRAPCADAPALVRLAVVCLEVDGTRAHCVVMTDLTEQRRKDVAIAAERAQMQARLLLADRMASLGTLAAGVAHEINNPLAYLVTSLESISRRLPELGGPGSGPSDEQTEWLRRQVGRARDGAERVRCIVRGLKGFSRADDETLGAVDPRRTLDTAIAMASNEIRHRAQLVKDYGTLPAVWANEPRLCQVFLNLLVNAAQAIPAGAADQNEISVSGRADAEGCAVIEVRDTGSGIEARDKARIFDPFFTTKPPSEGTGLGLALCHAIVASFAGQMTVESAVGKGSVFRVVLPAAPAAVPTTSPSVVAAAAIERRGSLLVIDDEPDICEAIQEAIAPFHDVVTATSAHRALEILRAGQRFDMILCDVRMPSMTGIDFRAVLRSESPAQATHVVLMSGGGSAYRPGDPPMPRLVLEKPFEIEQVLVLMRQAMPDESLTPA